MTKFGPGIPIWQLQGELRVLGRLLLHIGLLLTRFPRIMLQCLPRVHLLKGFLLHKKP